MSERAVAFVVARLSSSRLPAKQFRPIGGVAILDRILATLKTCSQLDEVVLATVAEAANEPLRKAAQTAGVSFFWYEGEVNDVTTRLRKAAEAHGADLCVLVSADCPLIHGPSIDECIERLRDAPEADCVILAPKAPDAYCLLEGVQVARRSAWQRADDLSDRPELREHQFPVIYRDPQTFRHLRVTLLQPVYGPPHRMSVDTWADLEFMDALHERLTDLGRPFTLPEATRLLDEEPRLRELNAHVYQRGLIEHPRAALFVADAGGEFGYGHFMRSRELAGQMVERLSWPARFLLDDEKAAAMAEDCGFPVHWGALERPARRAPPHRAATLPAQAAQAVDLVVVDVSARRTLPSGWSTRHFSEKPLVMIDREDPCALEAGLIVFPGVTGRARSPRAGGPRIVEGLDHAILRREMRRYLGATPPKEIDVLAYLYDEGQQEALAGFAASRGISCILLNEFTESFPKLLASSKVFVSGFGQSFYEALALKTLPVAWPLSPLHEADALAFYNAAGLAPTLLRNIGDIPTVLGPLFANFPYRLPEVHDGTPEILREIASFCENTTKRGNG